METIIIFIEVLLLVCISAICSGLNVAIMSLSVPDLKRKSSLGNAAAARVLPLRQNSHLTLASILIGNVGVISATSLVLDNKYNGLIAGVVSTLLIVVFGEVVPQALFSKHALRACDRFAPLLKVMIIATYPVSKPLQLLLDRLFGHEKSHLHTRGELGMIISEHANHSGSDLDIDEVTIMRGALQLSHKKVRDIMTPIKDVYWSTPETIIDEQKIDEIKEEEWSRIPIFDKDLSKVFGVLLMKDLVDIDFDEHPVPISSMTLHPTRTIGSKTALDTMFRHFINAHAHLMPVEKDDKIVGIVTIEDLIEEIIGHEIEDEKD